MTRLTAVATLCVFLTMPVVLYAGGLVQSLPKDGTWVKFYIELKAGAPQKIEISGTQTVRSVGRTTVDGQPCRWIELHLEQMQNGIASSTVTKILVAEKDVQSKAKRSPKIIRGWIQTNGNDPRALCDAEKGASGPFARLIVVPLSNRQTIKRQKVVDFQKGRLTIPTCQTGTTQIKTADSKIASGVTSTHHIWSDTSVPFGTAAVQIDMQYRSGKLTGPKMTMTFIVQDFGTGAKTALPNRE